MGVFLPQEKLTIIILLYFLLVYFLYFTDFAIIQKEPETPELEKGAVKAVQDLYDVVHHDILLGDKRSETSGSFYVLIS